MITQNWRILYQVLIPIKENQWRTKRSSPLWSEGLQKGQAPWQIMVLKRFSRKTRYLAIGSRFYPGADSSDSTWLGLYKFGQVLTRQVRNNLLEHPAPPPQWPIRSSKGVISFQILFKLNKGQDKTNKRIFRDLDVVVQCDRRCQFFGDSCNHKLRLKQSGRENSIRTCWRSPKKKVHDD